MRRGAAVAALLGAIAVAPAIAQQVRYEGAASVARGSYVFTQPTTSWTLSTGLAVRAGPVTFRAALPIYLQNTTLISGTIAGPLPTGGGGAATKALSDSSKARQGRGGRGAGGSGMMAGVVAPSYDVSATDPVVVPTSVVTGFRSALGDPSLQLGVSPLASGATLVDLALSVKPPLTDTTGFGTGRWDIGGTLAVTQRIGNDVVLGANAGYWHLGDLPDLDFRDPWLAGVMISYLRPSGWGLSMSASGARAVVDGFQNAYTLGASVLKLAGPVAVGVNGTVGLTETTPDFTIGVTWSVTLAGR